MITISGLLRILTDSSPQLYPGTLPTCHDIDSLEISTSTVGTCSNLTVADSAAELADDHPDDYSGDEYDGEGDGPFTGSEEDDGMDETERGASHAWLRH